MQIQHVTDKEMLRRTGVNALGYSYPKKDLILLKKGLTGKKKREVLAHEVEHMSKGEEGPFLEQLVPASIGALGSLFGGAAQGQSEDEQMRILREQTEQARGDLAPYREFGAGQLGSLQDWISGGGLSKPTMEQVRSSPGYGSRLGAIESSAAAKGGLFSGNALRDIGEFGASEYDRALGRQQNELGQRMGLANIGRGAAGQSAGLASQLGGQLSNIYGQQGQRRAGTIGDITSNITGGIGAHQGQQQWNDFLNRAYPKAGG